MIVQHARGGQGGPSIMDNIVSGVDWGQKHKINKAVEKRNEWKFKQLKTEVEDNRIQKLKAEDNAATWEAENGGGWGARNKVNQDNPDVFDASHVRSLSPDDIYDKAGKVMPAFLSGINSDTGATLDPTSETFQTDLKNFFKIYDEDGEKWGSFDSYAAGNNNYQTHRRGKLMEEEMLLSKIGAEKRKNQPKGKSPTAKENSAATYKEISKIPVKDRTPDQKKDLQIAVKDLELTKENAQNLLTGDDFTPILEQFSDGKWADNTDSYTPEMENSMAKAQMQGGVDFKGRAEVQGKIKTYKLLNSISNEFANLDADSYSGGAINKVVNEYAKNATGENWKNMKVSEKKKLLKTIGLKSKVGAATAQILNQISGASVSDEEFQRIMGVLTGGDIDLSNPQAVATALRESGSVYGDQAKSSIQGIRNKYSPYDKMSLVKELQAANLPLDKIKLTEPKTGGTTLKEGAVDQIADEAKQAKEVGGTLLKKAMGGDTKTDVVESSGDWLGNKWDGLKKGVSDIFSSDEKAEPESQNPKANPFKTLSEAKFNAIDVNTLKGDEKRLYRKEWLRRNR